jgi:hypothetical protein
LELIAFALALGCRILVDSRGLSWVK